jgi:hypothetical protein
MKKAPKIKPKPKQSTKTPATKEVVSEDNSFLDHLTPHLSGDAFTTSNLNSPNHPINKFLNVTTESFQEPETHQTSHMITEPENTQSQAINQPQIAEQSPIIVETLNNDTPLSSDPSSPSSEQPTQVYGPVYKPLTYDEFVIPSDQIHLS